MREAMCTQPEQLARLLADAGPAEAAAARLKGRRLLLVGIGTSWHAAHHGAWMLREAGVEAEPVHSADVAPYGRAISPEDGVIVLSHTGGTGYSMTMLERARQAGAETLHISGIGNGGELETVAAEASYAYTASHTGALARLAQIATALGARLGPLEDVAAACRRGARPPRPADRGPGPARRADRRRPERLDGAGGRAEDPRSVLRRGRGTVLRAVLPRPERGARRAGHARGARRWRPDGRPHGGDRLRGRGHRREGRRFRSGSSARRCRSSRSPWWCSGSRSSCPRRAA